ncbi:unnamed protein product [Paramecium octaurelia]|uniref:Uncharacterized protein n=1 Tax=Paramecium octaurelia TaxID=43137 RepID=A0A8S1Y3J9_PAROT|nr:unnamed protein product [Paramecium octaurelia]
MEWSQFIEIKIFMKNQQSENLLELIEFQLKKID